MSIPMDFISYFDLFGFESLFLASYVADEWLLFKICIVAKTESKTSPYVYNFVEHVLLTITLVKANCIGVGQQLYVKLPAHITAFRNSVNSVGYT